jgi:hypothetical protein
LLVARFAVDRWLRFQVTTIYMSPWILLFGFVVCVGTVVYLLYRSASRSPKP